ncbi:MAG TPA: extracellular solute-binding protein [Thiothrix sp.]|nr:extracellular solute-binding protein [Thiothrix sp.]
MLIVSFFSSLGLFFILSALIQVSHAEELEVKETVIVYNWEDYIPEKVLKDFTEETGIEVNYHTYNNNEIMYTTLDLQNGRGFDVIVPSTYLVDKMANEGLLQPINKEKLANFKHLDVSLLNKSFDQNNTYSVPYMWGSTAIGINTEKIKPEDVTSWHDLWHKHWRNQLFLIDDMLEIFYIALALDNVSLAQANEDDIQRAYQRLVKLIPNVKKVSADEPAAPFLSGDIDIGLIWNGDIVAAQEEKPSLMYIYPKEGVSFWMDNFVIPARAHNIDNAYTFIDYMLRPEVAIQCVEEYAYATANQTAKSQLDEAFRNNPAIFPPAEIIAKGDFQSGIGKKHELYQLYWDKLKLLRAQAN